MTAIVNQQSPATTTKQPRLKKDGTPYKVVTERNNLTAAQKHKLLSLVKDEYTTSDKNDVEFALYASDKLEFQVNPMQIGTARKAFELKPNKTEREKLGTLRERIQQLENFIKVNNLEVPSEPADAEGEEQE